MPKYPNSDNRVDRQREPRHAVTRARHVTSIGDLLTAVPALRHRATNAVIKQELIEWLRKRLEDELAPHAKAAEQQGGTLIVSADSAAWSTRLRYAINALLPEIEKCWPAIKRCQVRVQPSRR
jgi:hypothetical protein